MVSFDDKSIDCQCANNDSSYAIVLHMKWNFYEISKDFLSPFTLR